MRSILIFISIQSFFIVNSSASLFISGDFLLQTKRLLDNTQNSAHMAPLRLIDEQNRIQASCVRFSNNPIIGTCKVSALNNNWGSSNFDLRSEVLNRIENYLYSNEFGSKEFWLFNNNAYYTANCEKIGGSPPDFFCYLNKNI
jgi:hypothetical protein